MHIKFKLTAILNRLSYSLQNHIRPNFDKSYADGFEHAVKLFHIAFKKEFGEYVQISENLHQAIRDLKQAAEKSNIKIANQQRHIANLEMEKAAHSVIRMSNSQRKKIIRAIAEMTGQPYEYIKEQFNGLIQVKETNND